MTVLPSTRALLEHAVDYAGTFPPAALSLQNAVANYARERQGPDAWLLGRLVVPAGSLDELDAELAQEGRVAPSSSEYELSVIMSADARAQLARVGAFNQRWRGGARIVSVEFPPAEPADIPGLVNPVDNSLETFVEVPIDDHLDERLDAISRAGAAAKVRTGGTVPAAIPTPPALARFLHSCAARDLAFKATAGLHHALRSCYSLTYERDSSTAVMHGFVNVSVAAARARSGASVANITEALTESSVSAFHFGRESLVYRGSTTGLQDLASTRRLFFRSFGSCSFREPVEELARLQLV
ncbi:MAG: hypothetical protein EHM55_21145 [Acidobacteria bacterium]|nr:MAG: hypothetical protein EHM55_21145 [Acidobacteriota bacterium]